MDVLLVLQTEYLFSTLPFPLALMPLSINRFLDWKRGYIPKISDDAV
jgi:hypothetical protein